MRQVVVIILVAAVLACFPFPSLAQESSALINKALDEQVAELTLDEPIPRAMQTITSKTGISLREDPIIWELLPWGRDTTVKARIENKTLREALTAITRKLGLMMVLRDEYVELQPMPGLRRLAQRASLDELQALDLLASRTLGLDNNYPTIAQLLEAIDLKLAEEKDSGFAIENRTADQIDQDQTIFVPRNATLMDALEALPRHGRATWYPWGKSIVIVTREDRTRRLLAKPLTIRTGERGMELSQILLEISSRTGVPIEFQPGAIQAIAPEARTIRGSAENAPAQQILEWISGSTGLAYSIQDDNVVVSLPAPGTAAAARDPIVGFMQLDVNVQVVLRESEVPADLREYIRHKTEKEFAKMRVMMQEEGFAPDAERQ